MERDLLILRNEDVLRGFSPPETLTVSADKSIITIWGLACRLIPMACEYFDVVSASNGLVGIALLPFYDDHAEATCRSAKLQNAFWTELDEFVILLQQSNQWVIEGGPLLPAHFIFLGDTRFGFYIPGGLGSNPHDWNKFPSLDREQWPWSGS